MTPTAHTNDPALQRAIRRIEQQIARDQPAAVAGPADFWARIADLPVEEATAALEYLAKRGAVRRVRLNGQTFYIADPPHGGSAPATPGN